MTTVAFSLWNHGRTDELLFDQLERWGQAGRLTPEVLLEPSPHTGELWLASWLTRHVRMQQSELFKQYLSPHRVAQVALMLINQANAWQHEWDNQALVQTSDSQGNPRPSTTAELLFWSSSKDLLAEWKNTPAEAAMVGLIQGHWYQGTPTCPALPPLQRAIALDRREHAKWLLNHGAPINEPGPTGQTPIFSATSETVVKELLKKGADPTWRDDQGRLPAQAWVESNRSELRSDLMIQVLLRDHPDAYTSDILHRAVVIHTLQNRPFSSDNKPSPLYRRVKDQINKPFEHNGESWTLLGLWAHRALEKKEPERLKWALSTLPKSESLAGEVTDLDLARLAHAMKSGTLVLPDDMQMSWDKFQATYAKALALPGLDTNALQCFPATVLDRALWWERATPGNTERHLTSMGWQDQGRSALACLMDWVVENQGLAMGGWGPLHSLDPEQLEQFLCKTTPPADTLAPVLRLLSAERINPMNLAQEHPLNSTQWMTPGLIASTQGMKETRCLLAAWAQNAVLVRMSEGGLTPEEQQVLAETAATPAIDKMGLAATVQRWNTEVREQQLKRELPTASPAAPRLRF